MVQTDIAMWRLVKLDGDDIYLASPRLDNAEIMRLYNIAALTVHPDDLAGQIPVNAGMLDCEEIELVENAYAKLESRVCKDLLARLNNGAA